MWLKLTTVQLIALDKKKPKVLSAMVRNSRVNMDKINSYFPSAPEHQNHESEAARFNTILDATLVQEAGGVPYGIVFYVKETCEQIDDMIAAYGIDEIPIQSIEEAPTPTKPVETNTSSDSWGKSGW